MQALEIRTAPGDITGVSMLFFAELGHLPNLNIMSRFTTSDASFSDANATLTERLLEAPPQGNSQAFLGNLLVCQMLAVRLPRQRRVLPALPTF